ncbi:hypothetical protein MBLNU230_g7706t1 [Neophaeotheca triangularis]
MPSTSPGLASPDMFQQALPGAVEVSLQGVAAFVFRERRWIAYVSGGRVVVGDLTGGGGVGGGSWRQDVEVAGRGRGARGEGPEGNAGEAAGIDARGLLSAIAVESAGDQGRICVVEKGRGVWVLLPVVEGWTRVRWEKAVLLRSEGDNQGSCALSWGNGGEVLVAGSEALELFSTLPASRHSSPTSSLKEQLRAQEVEERAPLWRKSVASPVQFARFSPSASLIATSGKHDRLVKIWRRLSYEEGLFDYAYLSHPANVTHLEWRPLDEHAEERRGSGVSGRHDDDPEVLFTIASDGVLRIWRTGGMHDHDIMLLHTTVDLVAAIPHSPTLTTSFTHNSNKDLKARAPKPPRYAFVLPAADFSKAVTSAIGLQPPSALSHSLEHLKETSSRFPDVVVTLDNQGRMSAWGLQSIGHKRRPETPGSRDAFHIAHCEDLEMRFPLSQNARFEAWFEGGSLCVLAHGFEGFVGWWKGGIEKFFSPSAPGPERLRCVASWSGMGGGVVGLRSLGERGLVLSWTAGGEVAVWSPEPLGGALIRQCTFKVGAVPQDAIFLHAHDAVLVLTADELCLWNLRGRKLAGFKRDGGLASPARLLPPANYGQADQCYGAVLAASSTSSEYLLDLSADKANTQLAPGKEFTLPRIEDHGEVLFLGLVTSTSSKQYYVLVFEDGFLARVEDRRIHINEKSPNGPEITARGFAKAKFPTDVAGAKVFAANAHFAALVSEDRKQLSIVELGEGYVEYRLSTSEQIQHLSFFTSQNGHSLVAVGYRQHVDVLAQSRYEPDVGQASWLRVTTVSIQELGASIGALSWTADGKVIVAAGNGMLVANDVIERKGLAEEVTQAGDIPEQERFKVHDLMGRLAGPVPVWHPRLLSYLVLHHGETGSAGCVLRHLLAKLKFWSEGDELPPLLDMEIEEILTARGQNGLIDSSVVSGLSEQLSEKKLPGVSEAEQARLRTVIKTITYVSEHSNGLDANAIRFLFTWRFQTQQQEDSDDTLKAQTPPTPVQMPWRSILHAHHSKTQQPLLTLLLDHHSQRLTWPLARSLGLPFWLKTYSSLTSIFESLAQSAYRTQNPPDPVDASLHFLALNKKPTLLSLWRIATWHREQRSTMNFLKKDFEHVPEARTAARKNAYALMGRRRFEYAAAFFLLAGDVDAAVGVLAGQCGDLALAVGVARLGVGDLEEGKGREEGKRALERLVRERLLPKATGLGDRWFAAWCWGVLGKEREAARALVVGHGEVEDRGAGGVVVGDWRRDDPLALVLYRELGVVLPEHEYEAVLRGEKVLRRMGLDLIALDLVGRWEFKAATAVQTEVVEGLSEADADADTVVEAPATSNGTTAPTDGEPKSMLDDFAAASAPPPAEPPSMLDSFNNQPAPAVAESDEKAEREAKAAALMAKMKAKKDGQNATSGDDAREKRKPPPTQFKEPDANSLLDSFGF